MKGEEVGSAKNASRPQVGSFLSKTFAIFNETAYENFCAFSEEGDRIIIHNVHDFAAKILPRHFKHSNMQSFVRQLNMYGFRKIPSPPTTAQFKHPHFQRGRPDLLPFIKRKSAEEKKGGATKGRAGGAKGAASTDVMIATMAARIRELEAESASGSRTPQGGALLASGPGVFNKSGVISSDVDLTSIPRATDGSLNELVHLRESLDRLQTRMAAMESEHQELITTNASLWQALDAHQTRQTQLQVKLQRILQYMYNMHLVMGGTPVRRMQGANAMLPGGNQPISSLAESLFDDNLSYLCMQNPIHSSTTSADGAVASNAPSLSLPTGGATTLPEAPAVNAADPAGIADLAAPPLVPSPLSITADSSSDDGRASKRRKLGSVADMSAANDELDVLSPMELHRMPSAELWSLVGSLEEDDVPLELDVASPTPASSQASERSADFRSQVAALQSNSDYLSKREDKLHEQLSLVETTLDSAGAVIDRKMEEGETAGE